MGAHFRTLSRSSDPGPAAPPQSDRLESWKEVANYLRREVRTVQLWEKNEGLPIHRHFHKQLGSIYAFRSEIDSWAREVSKRKASANLAEGTGRSSEILGDGPHAKEGFLRILPLPAPQDQPEHQSLCDGIAGQVCALLKQYLPGHLAVIAPIDCLDSTPARYYLCWHSEIGSGALLEITASLRDSETEAELWSTQYHVELISSCANKTDTATQIAQCLWLNLVPERSHPALPKKTIKTASREIYLRGRYFWNQRTVESMQKAVRCFELAIRNEPEFALGYSGLADCLTLLSFYGIASPHELMPAARSAALRAIELAPDLAEAHVSLADVLLLFDRDWVGADYEYRKAIGCNPDYALGYHWYANLLTAHGHHEAANLAIDQALRIDPVSQITVVWAGVVSHLARRYDKAISHYQDALELNPRFAWAHMYMAQALEQKGNYEAALKEFETTINLAGGNNCVKAMKAHTFGIAGDRSSALQIVDEIIAESENKHFPSYDIAAVYAGLGERRESFTWLARACEERNMKLFSLAQDPRFDALHNSVEFKHIIDVIGLNIGSNQ